MPDTQPMVKGLIFLGALAHVRETYGEEKYAQFIGYLPKDAQERINKNQILPISQLPADHYQGLLEAYIKIFGEQQGIKNFQSGAATVAFKDLGTVMKFFMKIGSPGITASKFPSSYRRYFTHGHMTILEQSPTTLTIRLDEAQAYGRAGCLGSLGWMKEALVYSGAKSLQAKHDRCVFQGQDACTFSFAWE